MNHMSEKAIIGNPIAGPNSWVQKTIPAINPIPPIMAPIPSVRPANPFATCSAEKLLLDSNDGEMFS